MSQTRITNFARLAALLLLSSLTLVACNKDGGDGPVMSDEEKLKTFEKGHSAYGGGSGKVPGAAVTTAGAGK